MAAPRLPLSPDDPRELGPERPLAGWDAREYEAWRQRRAIHLYREEGLGVEAIAERLGYQRDNLVHLLNDAGIRVRGDGREHGDDAAPFGPPA